MLESTFIQATAGRVFTSCFIPPSGQADTWLLFCPPWAEEMNKSRRMMARLGHGLAEQGIATCLPDLHGTGDSSGDFADARWETWHQDLILLTRWLGERGCRRLYLGGLRAGALLALDVLAELAPRPQALLLWQPVVGGRQQLTQFLRLRMAAAMAGGDSESVSSLRERLASGRSLEVAGYELSPQLADALEQRNLQDMLPPPGTPVFWLETGSGDARSLPPVSRQVIDTWQAAGVEVYGQRVPGDPFWTTQELVDVPSLVDASIALLADLA